MYVTSFFPHLYQHRPYKLSIGRALLVHLSQKPLRIPASSDSVSLKFLVLSIYNMLLNRGLI